MERETYYVAKLMKEGEFLSSEIFESMEEARVWGRETALSIMRDLEVLEKLELEVIMLFRSLLIVILVPHLQQRVH